VRSLYLLSIKLSQPLHKHRYNKSVRKVFVIFVNFRKKTIQHIHFFAQIPVYRHKLINSQFFWCFSTL